MPLGQGRCETAYLTKRIDVESKLINSRFLSAALTCLLAPLLAWLSLGAALAQEALVGRAAGANARIEVLGAGFAQAGAVAPSQGRLVLYRLRHSGAQDALTVLVGGRYHASLVEGGFSDACLSPGTLELGVRQVRVGDGGRDGVQQILALPLPAGSLVYVRVDGLQLQPVPPAQAQLEMAGLRQQMHTVSRLQQNCLAAAPAPAQPAGPQRHELILLADSTFDFGRSDEASLTPLGRQQLIQLAQRLRNDFAQIHQIQITGHADPIGNASANEALALARAQTVQQLLATQVQAFSQAPLQLRGAGSREPQVSGCPLQASPGAIRCHAPNRRVNIEVTGLRR